MDNPWIFHGYPLVNIQKTIEHGPVEIVDLPIKHVDFPVRYVAVYQRVPGLTSINEVVNVVVDADVSLLPIPIGSMYAIYGNIYHPYTPNVSIYTIHGSYGLVHKAEKFCYVGIVALNPNQHSNPNHHSSEGER